MDMYNCTGVGFQKSFSISGDSDDMMGRVHTPLAYKKLRIKSCNGIRLIIVRRFRFK